MDEVVMDSGISGRTKAALLMGFLPVESSKKIIRFLEDASRDVLIKEMTSMQKYDLDIIEDVVKDYLSFMKGTNLNVNSGAEFTMKLLEGSVPKEELEEIMSRIYNGNAKPFDSLKRLRDIGPLLTYLQYEDSQTIAMIASHMKPSQSAQLMQFLPEDKLVEVARAVANLDQTNKEILTKIENHLTKKLESFISSEQSQTDGVKTLVGILNNVTRATEKMLFDKLDIIDSELSRVIKDNMFVFDDIVTLDTLSLQKVISKITDNELIAKALRQTTEEMKEKFFISMPEQRRIAIKDVEEGLGRIRLSDVEEAQQRIAGLVKELEKTGDVIISRGDSDVIL
jgi:flagellar motor switch protein FliG